MVWSKDLFARQDNGGSVPAGCLDKCSDALLIAQAQGLKSQLCAPNSAFIEALDSCSACIKTQGPNPRGGILSISPLLPFLEFCHLLSYSTLMYTSTNGQITTIVYLLPTNNAATNTSSSSRTITTSKKTSRATTPSRTSTLAIPTSLAPQNAASSPSVSATPPSHAWIAGPVVGSIVGLAIVFGVSFYLWRRRYRHSKPDNFDPAQLHSDCIPKPELDAQTNMIHELDAQPELPRAEMPVK
ncbi:hypothetical protein N5P37_000205 [Trichoderma harzianum]|uniref:Uncharacterized protein n=1 Tax=Trichoderma harzianum CBS 226.95 TaxID=983964 RepID=A0A2T4A1B0_TRIHA|nr:hypothetical protein M431DRAFT_533863 [Trichoderma harzianum CBS 226.95]KAK0766480.1 hypothetical protein N5P37_000205 [Trichoderma harzianum]PKK46086.1 hypothetical protein CI102_9227 [Trichoderma harzianum]PTB50857.1 hypothetical protein M431DRAFT_533863 [Trichoderma harzianum CBS 226.95]